MPKAAKPARSGKSSTSKGSKRPAFLDKMIRNATPLNKATALAADAMNASVAKSKKSAPRKR